jgi:hypothetical protein
LIDHYRPQNDGITSPKRSPLVEPPLLYHLLQACLFLVGCCVYPHQSAAILGLGVIHFILFFCCPNRHPKDGTTSPHTLQLPRALSPTSLLPLSLISGWLLCVLLSFGHKANSLPVSLLFEGYLYGAQNRGTNRVMRKLGARRLAWVLR